MKRSELKEAIKSGIKSVLSENRYDINDPNSPLGRLNDEYESSGLKGIVDNYGLDVVLMMLSSGEYGDRLNETSTDKYDDNPALKGKQSDLPDGLQKAIIKKSGGKVNETRDSKVNDLVYKLTFAVGGADSLLTELIRAMSTDDAMLYLSAIAKDYDMFDDAEELEEKAEANESFDSLVKKVDKAKGYTKKEAEKVAGAIAAKKMKGAGKGPTAKQKKRMAEEILKELRK